MNRVETVLLTITPDVPSPLRKEDPFFFCRLELDINTAAEREGQLPSDKYSELVDELGGILMQIANHGEPNE